MFISTYFNCNITSRWGSEADAKQYHLNGSGQAQQILNIQEHKNNEYLFRQKNFMWLYKNEARVVETKIGVPPNRVVDPDPEPDWIRIQSGMWIRIRIRIQEGKNDPQK